MNDEINEMKNKTIKIGHNDDVIDIKTPTRLLRETVNKKKPKRKLQE